MVGRCGAQPSKISEPSNVVANAKASIVTHLTLLGDETHISAINAAPRSYIDKAIVIVGAVKTANYYNFSYSEDSANFYSLSFYELTEDMKIIGELAIYARRSFAKPLIDAVLRNEEKGNGKLVRLKICITNRSFSYSDYSENAELLD